MSYLFVYDGYVATFGNKSGLTSEIHASGAAVSAGESFVLVVAGEARRAFQVEFHGNDGLNQQYEMALANLGIADTIVCGLCRTQ